MKLLLINLLMWLLPLLCMALSLCLMLRLKKTQVTLNAKATTALMWITPALFGVLLLALFVFYANVTQLYAAAHMTFLLWVYLLLLMVLALYATLFLAHQKSWKAFPSLLIISLILWAVYVLVIVLFAPLQGFDSWLAFVVTPLYFSCVILFPAMTAAYAKDRSLILSDNSDDAANDELSES